MYIYLYYLLIYVILYFYNEADIKYVYVLRHTYGQGRSYRRNSRMNATGAPNVHNQNLIKTS